MEGASGKTSSIPTFSCIMGVLEGKDREQEIENHFEKIMTENFPNSVREIHIYVQEVQRVPNNVNPRGPHQNTS